MKFCYVLFTVECIPIGAFNGHTSLCNREITFSWSLFSEKYKDLGQLLQGLLPCYVINL